MITFVKGNMFLSPADVLVNTVNTTGVMGRGIAKEFKDVFPEMFDVYRACCREGALSIGKLMLYRTSHKWLLNFPTKRHFRYPSRLEYVESGLQTFVSSYEKFGLTSVAFPQLGCGTGGLDWESEVLPLMERHLGGLPIDVYIYIYDSTGRSPRRGANQVREWLRAAPRGVAFAEFWNDLGRLLPRLKAGSDGYEQANARIGEHEGCSGLELRKGDSVVELNRDDLFDFWRQLRSFGFLSAHDLGSMPGWAAEVFLDVLVQLPYVERAVYAMDRNALSTAGSSGVQFRSPTSAFEGTTQGSFFGGGNSPVWIESLTPMRSMPS